MPFSKGNVYCGRQFVKVDTVGVPANAQVGQWVRQPGDKTLSRLAKDGRIVQRNGKSKKHKSLSMAGFRLACGKSPAVVLSKGVEADTIPTVEQAVGNLLAAMWP